MVKLSGAELDFYKERKVRVCLDNGEEYMGFVQRYSTIGEPSENGFLQIGELGFYNYNIGVQCGNSGVSHRFNLKKIKKLEPFALKELEEAVRRSAISQDLFDSIRNSLGRVISG